MEVTAESWQRIGSELTVLRALVVLMAKRHPERQFFINAVRSVGKNASERLLGQPVPDYAIDSLTVASEALAKMIEAGP